MIEKNLEIEKSAEKEEPKEIVKEPVKTKNGRVFGKTLHENNLCRKGNRHR